ncbi:TPA: Y4yA family PLP-dependent enzyme [Corynebacterium striatum]|uniref:Diaminopimelate decarboxylase n=1 Tax=Corynebacterium striatum TaxID=43770 RepID=A0ABC8CL60_CORST|nr:MULTISPECIES: diaminopimelate decarboxylase [Corynebacterium]ATZ06218.1 diaminopimelate decarboxylase [Corynebacterium striatum]ATZ09386.1 diaminopimelate decarboxylase [Corynebacterium striatum]EGT5576176.1 Y4yA family PLP-dependent enzyme [Corynebacterium striatum]EGT5592728.1 Y4yA family PLP-dependent enzyme [Corynebacterium striatum]EGT5595361.1 Y4yA family PLP-dependent enzyme [Corynebacterium striatum]
MTASSSQKPGQPTEPPRPLAVHGTVPLAPRLEPWMQELIADPHAVRALIEKHGSPVNVLDPRPLARNAAELVDAGTALGVDTRVFFARKANKALAFVGAARAAGHGVDVASLNELRQVLAVGVPPKDVILSAAIKDERLLRTAVKAGVVISCDSRDELARIAALGTPARIAPRLAPDPTVLPPTRFGERLDVWRSIDWPDTVEAVGVHVHLHGYAESDRRLALAEAITLVEALRAAGHPASFIDIGGGVPMSYLLHETQWEQYRDRIERQRAGTGEPFTWKNDPLTNTYPFWQTPTRGEWFTQLLKGKVSGYGTAATALREHSIALHLEPGRSLLDGCGMILAEVSFLKERSDGLPLIGLAMNRTQCRTAADDLLLDPFLVPTAGEVERAPRTGFLVGAYCIEDEVILRRALDFPDGIAVGDTLAIPNTAGYFMHILESASHQIPLARNVVRTEAEAWELDAIDREWIRV